uniref:Uncharacterized protein n=1 Tax=Oryza punctata TaxID=4537 RepID=A0A0E0JIM4_ORYPU
MSSIDKKIEQKTKYSMLHLFLMKDHYMEQFILPFYKMRMWLTRKIAIQMNGYIETMPIYLDSVQEKHQAFTSHEMDQF